MSDYAKIIRAVKNDDREEVKRLVQVEGVKPNIHSYIGLTPIHIAAEDDNSEMVGLLLQLSQESPDITDGNEYNYYGKSTPLHYAAYEGKLKAASHLVEKSGADPNACDYVKGSPLHYASDRGDSQLARYLIEKAGATIDAHNIYGQTPFQLANNNGKCQVASYLKQKQYLEQSSGEENSLAVFSQGDIFGGMPGEESSEIFEILGGLTSQEVEV
jgi:ankyrin repeat protein